jgi:DNA-binding winged helix-turn-helix (wHTH) protein
VRLLWRPFQAAVLGNLWEFAGFTISRPVKLTLGELTFDAETRQLLRGGAEVHLSPKAFDLLSLLIDHRPRALSKQELHERLWPATFVSDGNLASLVAEIREALGDAARQPRFVRTSHRFGYAFCGEAVDAATAARSGEPTSFCWLVQDGRRLPLRPGDNILGRDDDCIQIESPTVSRRHARISIAGPDAVLDDLGSKNGTFVGGEPVATAIRLKDGDEIRTGSVVFRFRMTLPKGSTATWGGPRRPS